MLPTTAFHARVALMMTAVIGLVNACDAAPPAGPRFTSCGPGSVPADVPGSPVCVAKKPLLVGTAATPDSLGSVCAGTSALALTLPCNPAARCQVAAAAAVASLGSTLVVDACTGEAGVVPEHYECGTSASIGDKAAAIEAMSASSTSVGCQTSQAGDARVELAPFVSKDAFLAQTKPYSGHPQDLHRIIATKGASGAYGDELLPDQAALSHKDVSARGLDLPSTMIQYIPASRLNATQTISIRFMRKASGQNTNYMQVDTVIGKATAGCAAAGTLDGEVTGECRVQKPHVSVRDYNVLYSGYPRCSEPNACGWCRSSGPVIRFETSAGNCSTADVAPFVVGQTSLMEIVINRTSDTVEVITKTPAGAIERDSRPLPPGFTFGDGIAIRSSANAWWNDFEHKLASVTVRALDVVEHAGPRIQGPGDSPGFARCGLAFLDGRFSVQCQSIEVEHKGARREFTTATVFPHAPELKDPHSHADSAVASTTVRLPHLRTGTRLGVAAGAQTWQVGTALPSADVNAMLAAYSRHASGSFGSGCEQSMAFSGLAMMEAAGHQTELAIPTTPIVFDQCASSFRSAGAKVSIVVTTPGGRQNCYVVRHSERPCSGHVYVAARCEFAPGYGPTSAIYPAELVTSRLPGAMAPKFVSLSYGPRHNSLDLSMLLAYSDSGNVMIANELVNVTAEIACNSDTECHGAANTQPEKFAFQINVEGVESRCGDGPIRIDTQRANITSLLLAGQAPGTRTAAALPLKLEAGIEVINAFTGRATDQFDVSGVALEVRVIRLFGLNPAATVRAGETFTVVLRQNDQYTVSADKTSIEIHVDREALAEVALEDAVMTVAARINTTLLAEDALREAELADATVISGLSDSSSSGGGRRFLTTASSVAQIGEVAHASVLSFTAPLDHLGGAAAPLRARGLQQALPSLEGDTRAAVALQAQAPVTIVAMPLAPPCGSSGAAMDCGAPFTVAGDITIPISEVWAGLQPGTEAHSRLVVAFASAAVNAAGQVARAVSDTASPRSAGALPAHEDLPHVAIMDSGDALMVATSDASGDVAVSLSQAQNRNDCVAGACGVLAEVDFEFRVTFQARLGVSSANAPAVMAALADDLADYMRHDEVLGAKLGFGDVELLTMRCSGCGVSQAVPSSSPSPAPEVGGSEAPPDSTVITNISSTAPPGTSAAASSAAVTAMVGAALLAAAAV